MAAIRGMLANPSGTKLWVVHGNEFQAVARDGTRQKLGTLRTRQGFVDMKLGASQLVIVDGPNGYVYAPTGGSFNRITAAGWRGSVRVGLVKGSYLFADPNTGLFYISAPEDANSIDLLDFATASSSPDDIVAPFSDHGEAWLFGDSSTEVWSYSGAADFPLEQNPGATMQTGLMGAFTVCSLDNTLYWLGRDENGAGVVWRSQGYQPVRVSNTAVEQSIQRSIEAGVDMRDAIAFAYQQNGHSFYVLQVPGLDTTWAFDVASSEWHERAEFVNGKYRQHRAKHHAYCYGKHIVGGDDGKLYAFDVKANTNAGDILVRDRVSPHYATPQQKRIKFGTFRLDCTVGKGKPDGSPAAVMLRTSDDGGETWDDWRTESLGGIGETANRGAVFLRNGSATDRVWHTRCTDDVPFAIVGADVEGAA